MDKLLPELSRNEAKVSPKLHRQSPSGTNGFQQRTASSVQTLLFWFIFCCGMFPTPNPCFFFFFSPTLRAFLGVSKATTAPCIYFHQITRNRTMPYIAQWNQHIADYLGFWEVQSQGPQIHSSYSACVLSPFSPSLPTNFGQGPIVDIPRGKL